MIGFGTAALQRRQMVAARTVSSGASVLFPGPLWNGTAGSGYGGSPPVTSGTLQNIREDMGFMTVEAAVINPVWPLPCDEMLTGDREIMVRAFANDGTGAATGIAHVIFHCEGRQMIVSEPVWREYDVLDWAGAPAKRWGLFYVAPLSYADFASNGAAMIYMTAVPVWLARIAPRTIGPYRIYRKPAVDRVIEIRPSQAANLPVQAPTITAAISWLTTGSNWPAGHHVELRCMENVYHDMGNGNLPGIGSAFNTGNRGGAIIINANGSTCTVARGSPTDDLAITASNSLRPGLYCVHWRGWQFDMSNWQSYYTENAASRELRPHLFERCTFFSRYNLANESALGVNKGGRSEIFRTGGAVTRQCHIRDMNVGGSGINSQITIGNLHRNLEGEGFQVATNTGTLFEFNFHLGNRFDNCGGYEGRLRVNNMAITYSGAGTPGLEVVGTHNSTSRALVLRVNGAEVFRLTATANNGTMWLFSQAAAAINAFGNGWTATHISDSRLFSNITPSPTNPVATGAIAITSGVPVAVGGAVDSHSDFIQFFNGGSDNSDISENVALRSSFWFTMQSTGEVLNCMILGNRWHQRAEVLPLNYHARLTGGSRHLMMLHNTLNDTWYLDARDGAQTMADTSAICNNVFMKQLRYAPWTPANVYNGLIADNRFYDVPDVPLPNQPNITGNVRATTPASADFPGWDTNDFQEEHFAPIAGQWLDSARVARRLRGDGFNGLYTSPALAGASASARLLVDFSLSNASVATQWGRVAVGDLVPTGAPAGAYFVLVDEPAGFAVENG